MRKQGKWYYVFTILATIAIALVMVAAFNSIGDVDYRIGFTAITLIINVAFIIYFASSKLTIVEDISHNEIIAFRSIFGTNSLHINHINKIIFIRRKNFLIRNVVYLFDKFDDTLILDGNNRVYHRLLREAIDKSKYNKDIIIDNELLEFLQINNCGTLYEVQDVSKTSKLNAIKEDINYNTNSSLYGVKINPIKWILTALTSSPTNLIVINFLIPVIGTAFF